MKRLHLLITGRVQGVFFRTAARRRAQGLGLTGWARNLPDGRVEVVAEGAEADLKSFLAWAGQGPVAARVDGVAARWAPAKNSFSFFDIK